MVPENLTKRSILSFRWWWTPWILLCQIFLSPGITNAAGQGDEPQGILVLLDAGEPKRQSVEFIAGMDGVVSQRPLKSIANVVKLAQPGIPGGVLSQTGQILTRIHKIEITPEADVNLIAASLSRHPGIALAEPIIPIQLQDAHDQISRPDDLQFGQQWHLENTGEFEGSKEGEDIEALAAWDKYTGDPNFTVAIIDTGIDFFHPDLEANIWLNEDEIPGNGLDDDGNGYIDDVHGYDFTNDDSDPYDDNSHGTHVAGIAGAVGNNGIGITGVAWRMNLMALKAFNERGSGDSALAVEAIDYAVANGAKIINASWGSDDRSRILEQVLKSARADGVLTFAAAGNDQSNIESYPAFFDDVIAVGAVGVSGQRSEFSNFGSWVDLSAPGSGIFSTKVNNTYGALNGTSMATPVVSGVAALVWGKNPDFSLIDVENIILSSVDKLETKEELGSGRINARKALAIEEPIPTVRLRIPREVSGLFNIFGSASGESLDRYILELGEGIQPDEWITISEASEIIENGILFPNFSTASLKEGEYTIRLRATNSQGNESSTQRRFKVNNVDITSPDNNDFLPYGGMLEIKGSVFGLGRTYSLSFGEGINPESWSEEGIEIPEYQPGTLQDEMIGIWNTNNLEPGKFYSLRLISETENGDRDSEFSWMIYFDEEMITGWPLVVDLPQTDTRSLDWRNFKVVDLDADGDSEIILVRPSEGELEPAILMVFDHRNQLLWTRALSAGKPVAGSAVVGNLDDDTELEIVADGGGGRIFAFHHDGKPLEGRWPISLPGKKFGKSIADIDGDGLNEVVAFNNEAYFLNNEPVRKLAVLGANGDLLWSWNVNDCFHDIDVVELAASIADMDGDGDLELIVPTGCGSLGMFDHKKTLVPVWEADVTGQILSSPVIGDLDGDADLEVIVSVHDPESANRGGIHAFDQNGKRFGSFPVLLEHSFPDGPILADLDNDSDIEIIVNDRYDKQIHVLHHDGFHADGWPTKPLFNENFRGQVAVGDIDGDSELEILAPVHGIFFLFANSGDTDKLGGIRIYEPNGQSYGRVGQPNPNNWLPIPSPGAEVGDKNHLIQLHDIDGNGKLDVLLASVFDMSYVPNDPVNITPKDSFSIHAWELDTPWRDDLFPWNSFHVNSSQTGYFNIPPKPNALPEIADIPGQVAPEADLWVPYNLGLFINDPDHRLKDLTIEVFTDLPLVASLDERLVLTVSTEDAGWQGNGSVRVSVTDPRGGITSKLIDYVADRSLNFPEANPDTETTIEDTPVVLNLLENDTDPQGNSLQLLSIGRSESGRITMLDQGNVRFIPQKDFFGEARFRYFVRSESGGQSVGEAIINVTPVNDPPIVIEDRILLEEDTTVILNPMDNDFDPEEDAFQIVELGAPEHGTLAPHPDGHFFYSPDENFFGEDQVFYAVEDSHGARSEGFIRLVVKPVNDVPRARNIQITINQNSLGNITFKADDPDKDKIQFKIGEPPKNGDVLAFPTVAEYIPKDGFVGIDSFTYIASDPFSESEPATVTITVEDKNNPPEARRDKLFTLVNQPVEITFKAEDPDDDPFTIIIDEDPENGVLTPTDTEDIFLYSPDEGFAGVDTITFHARDQEDDGPTALITIEVTDENTPPKASDQFVSTRQDVPVEFDLLVSDREGTPLTLLIQKFPESGDVIASDTRLVYTPNPEFIGVEKITYMVSDGVQESRLASVFIRVKFPNDEPEVVSKRIVLLKGQRFTFDLPVTDPDGDILRSAIVDGPEHGRVYGRGVTYTFRPNASYTGNDTLTFRSWDGHTYGSIGTVEIEVRSTPVEVDLSINDFSFFGDNQYVMDVSATNGETVVLEFSTDLIHWEIIESREAVNRQILFTGTIPAQQEESNFPHGFFRLKNVSSAAMEVPR